MYDNLYHALNDNLFEILDILYSSKSSVVFKSVIKQPDGYSCGVFAIVFATSLIFGRNPSDECYIIDYNNMICKTWTLRNHLNNILVSTLLQLFPTHHTHVAQSTDILSLKNKKIKIIKTKTAIGRKKRKSIINKNIRIAMQGNKKNIEWNNKEKSAFNYSPIVDYKNSRHIKIGLMNKLSNFCDALKWSAESLGLCCSNGKIKLKSIEDPPEPLRSLIFGENITKSKSFLTAIRKYIVRYK